MAHVHANYTLRVPQIYREKLSYIAGENARTLNSEIELLMKKRIETYEKKHGEITSADIEEFKKNKRIK